VPELDRHLADSNLTPVLSCAQANSRPAWTKL
jgi:hypothetical protein